MKSKRTLGFKRSVNPRLTRMPAHVTAITLCLALNTLVAPARAQDAPTDVIFRDTFLRATISMLAN